MQSVDRPPRRLARGSLRSRPRPTRAPPRRRALGWLPLVTLFVGLAVTLTLALVSLSQYNNQSRLLALRVRDASLLVEASLPSVQTSLASVAEAADATNGSVAQPVCEHPGRAQRQRAPVRVAVAVAAVGSGGGTGGGARSDAAAGIRARRGGAAVSHRGRQRARSG